MVLVLDLNGALILENNCWFYFLKGDLLGYIDELIVCIFLYKSMGESELFTVESRSYWSSCTRQKSWRRH